ncbi:TetR/AcrR family transcriptional regulator [Phaeacidiphilus oryzae]|uniref:TetR/AcrR family transcriptional regulator n=1 Tax=Phaeacidiphilus oryzae TaxID=348818 RepID=UPI00068B2AF0|nr:TetR/AcrR family transcriptional regulator [Phaeacidiphilus oryzae]
MGGEGAGGRASGPAGRQGRYHHGDLREALIDTAVDLLGERGAATFSMAEASRRLGVASSAPYRHFTDREALLAAVAVRAAGLLAERLAAESGSGGPEERLAAAAAAYVRFAHSERALFLALSGSALDKARHPGIARAAEPVAAAFLAPAAALADGDRRTAERLVSAVVATAHGHAALLLDGVFAPAGEAGDAAPADTASTADAAGTAGTAECAARRAAAAVRALVAGRDALV